MKNDNKFHFTSLIMQLFEQQAVSRMMYVYSPMYSQNTRRLLWLSI
ncbi:hypothetical protein NTHI1209_01681 [Haemophilus influenzae]|uniref:Uncharacterized protein n=1 Tax=Haemophilus influenzae TaxID=727 RepID=A0A158SYU7_HAEIF|nr:hypothetical protein NTHI1209_01681 [Haemophilus influenzae]